MVSKHLKHINNLKNLKVENVKALLKDSFIREGAFLEMKENCNPANGEAIDKALAAHSRKPAVTSATNIKEKNDYLFYLYAAFAVKIMFSVIFEKLHNLRKLLTYFTLKKILK